MSVRVLLCDGQTVWRAGLRAILSEQPDIEIVGEASDGARAVELARSLAPDLVLMDLRMPGLDGVQATLRLAGPTVRRPARVVILTILDADAYALEALHAGATGFLLKDLPGPELLDAVRLAATGAMVLAPSVTRRLLDQFARHGPAETAGPEAALEHLTGREREVLGLVALGRLNHEIAAALGVGEATVRSHVARLLTKLGLRDRAQLVVLAFRAGLVTPGSLPRAEIGAAPSAAAPSAEPPP